MAKKVEKLEGKVKTSDYYPTENYDYQRSEVGDSDHFLFKRGNEKITVELKHPHHEVLTESYAPANEETIYHGDMKYSSQRTLFDKPYGRTTGPVIDNLHATEGAKADVGTALGVVLHHSLKRFGVMPQPSDDLSPHSRALVAKIHENAKGIPGVKNTVPSYPKNETTKEAGAQYAISDIHHYFNDPRYKDIPEEKLREGSSTIRGLFAGRHLNKQQFHQPELPFGDK